MEQIQRDAAMSIGFSEETWNAQFSSSSTTTTKEQSQTQKMKEITLENVHSASAYELRQELKRRKKYDPKKDGDACYRNFLRIMVNVLEQERLKSEEEEMKKKEEERLEQMKLVVLKRNKMKESRRSETKTVVSEKHEKGGLETVRPSVLKPGTERIPILQMPRRF